MLDGLFDALPDFLTENADTLALEIGGALASSVAQRKALQQRRAIQQALQQQQDALRSRSMATANEYVEAAAPAARDAQLRTAEEDLKRQMTNAAGTAASVAPVDEPAGKVSGRYRETADRAVSASSERVRRAIEAMAKAGSFGHADSGRSLTLARAGGEVADINRQSDRLSRAAQIDIDSVAPNPYALAIGEGLTGWGQGERLKKALARARGGVLTAGDPVVLGAR